MLALAGLGGILLVTLPNSNYWRLTHFFNGIAAPEGAAVVYCVAWPGQVLNDAAVDALHDAFVNNLTPSIGTNWSIFRTRAKQGPDSTGPSLDHDEIDNGGLAGASLAPNTCYLIHKRTAAGGRRQRGRMYLPGPIEGEVTDAGALVAARQAALQTAVENWRLAVEGVAGRFLAIEHEPGISPPPAVPTTITSLSVDSRVATQRGRLRR